MALTDRIAALVDAIAAAFNARVQAPASAYDLAVLNGFQGTQAQWLATFTSPASTTQQGLVRLASQAEAIAGTEATKALTASVLGAGVRSFAPTYARTPTNFTGAPQWVRIGRTTSPGDGSGAEFNALISNLGSFADSAHGAVHLAVGIYGKSAIQAFANLHFANDEANWDVGYVKTDYGVDIWVKMSNYNDQIGVTLLDNQFAVILMDSVLTAAPTGYTTIERRPPGRTYRGGLSLGSNTPRQGNTAYRNEVWTDQTHAFVDAAITVASATSRDGTICAVPAGCKPFQTAMIAAAINLSDGSWAPAYVYITEDLNVRLLTSTAIPANSSIQFSGTYRRRTT